jgi:hypothetical protein
VLLSAIVPSVSVLGSVVFVPVINAGLGCSPPVTNAVSLELRVRAVTVMGSVFGLPPSGDWRLDREKIESRETCVKIEKGASSLLTINWLETCRSDGTVAGHRKACGKIGPNAFAAGLSAQHGGAAPPC